MSDVLRLTRIAKVGIAKVGNTRVGLIPSTRDRRARAAGDTPKLFYAHGKLIPDETDLGHTEVEA